MKKFLTVLLVIAVMFTFSFGSAFAAPTASNVVESKAEAIKLITDTVASYEQAVNAEASELVRVYKDGDHTYISKEAYTAVVNEYVEELLAELHADKVAALNELEKVEKGMATSNVAIQGYIVKADSAADKTGYVDVVSIISDKIDAPAAILDYVGNKTVPFTDEAALALVKEEFALVKAEALAEITAIDPTVYSDVKDANGESDVDRAVEIKRNATTYVGAIKLVSNDTYGSVLTKIQNITDAYRIDAKGTAGETLAGDYGLQLKALKKAATDVTDAKKAEYAKALFLSEVKAALEAGRATEVKAQNDIILAQELSAKPNAKTIKAAQEAIETINAQYDAMAEVWTYRIENATIKNVASGTEGLEYVLAYYNNEYYGKLNVNAYVGSFTNNVFKGSGIFADNAITATELKGVLSAADAVAIAKAVDALEAEAAALKATIYVDGDVAANVDAALADAVEETYMTGSLTVKLNPVTVKDAAHARIHTLIESAAKVTVEGKKYPAVEAWDDNADNVYDETKEAEVYAVVKAAKAALKACETVEEADAAFLAAYAEFDAIMTDAEHELLFVYGGELYEAYGKAVAEVKAYVGYKAELMDDTYPGADVEVLKTYLTETVMKAQVYSAADLTAKTAEAKATVDALKTKAEMKAEDAALAKKVLAVAVPVTAAAKDEVVALYKEVVAFNKYADMVDYTVTKADKTGLIKTYVDTLADIEEEAIADAKAAIDKDNKIKLDEKAAVEALAAAVKAYNDLYAYDLETETALSAAKYTDAIFALEVDEVEAQIAALPVGAAAADVAAARAAVEALGFDGICQMSEKMLEKLAKFEDDAEVEAIYAVQALKITAKSTAKKGSITVKWSVEGDADAVDYYVVAKSTKANKGFKKAIETTKLTYKNTKELKKGTRYYYKVKAVAVVDGVEYTSDWSNKAYRKAK